MCSGGAGKTICLAPCPTVGQTIREAFSQLAFFVIRFFHGGAVVNRFDTHCSWRQQAESATP